MNASRSDFDERLTHASQNAHLDRQVERRLSKRPRFTITRAIDGSEVLTDAVWDHQTNVFHPVGEMVAALFAAFGLGCA